MIGIYKITSPSEKVYIGQTWDSNLRENHYQSLNCKGQPKLYNSLKKYGFHNHEFEIIHELPQDISQEILDKYEVLYINQYKECGFELMNIKEGGRGGKHAQETKDKISKKLKGRDISKWKHKMYSDERNIKISKNRKYKCSEYTKSKLSLIKKGTKLSEEAKQKIGQSKIGNKYALGYKNRKVPIICINNGNIFNSIKEASEILKIGVSSIKKVLSGQNKQTRNKLIFKYLNK